MTEKGAQFEEQKRRYFDGVLQPKVAERLDEDYLAEQVVGCDALMSVYVFAKITRRVIEAGGTLKVIARYGVGTDNIDVAAATERGIVVTYLPSYHLPSVPELAIALLFALARRIPAGDRHVRAGQWRGELFCGVDVEGKTLGLLGLGRTGAMVARKALALGMKVVGYDASLGPEQVGIERLRHEGFDTVVREADFLSVHVPLTDQTRNLIDASVLARMKPTAYLINTARGPIVDEEALYDALKQQRIAGAALDVMATEPPGPHHKLYGLDNVIFTPHVGGTTVEATDRAVMTAAKSVVDVLRGRTPEYVRNPEVLPRLHLA